MYQWCAVIIVILLGVIYKNARRENFSQDALPDPGFPVHWKISDNPAVQFSDNSFNNSSNNSSNNRPADAIPVPTVHSAVISSIASSAAPKTTRDTAGKISSSMQLGPGQTPSIASSIDAGKGLDAAFVPPQQTKRIASTNIIPAAVPTVNSARVNTEYKNIVVDKKLAIANIPARNAYAEENPEIKGPVSAISSVAARLVPQRDRRVKKKLSP